MMCILSIAHTGVRTIDIYVYLYVYTLHVGPDASNTLWNGNNIHIHNCILYSSSGAGDGVMTFLRKTEGLLLMFDLRYYDTMYVILRILTIFVFSSFPVFWNVKCMYLVFFSFSKTIIINTVGWVIVGKIDDLIHIIYIIYRSEWSDLYTYMQQWQSNDFVIGGDVIFF